MKKQRIAIQTATHAMWKIIFLMGIAFYFLATSACGGDDDETIPDLCAGVTCLNDGICINGGCECPEGYEGRDCGTEQSPVKIKVNKLTVKEFGDDLWDGNPGEEWADIMFDVHREGLNGFVSDHIQNVSPDSEAVFEGLPLFKFNYPEQEYFLEVYDHDGWDANDLIGDVRFVPNALVEAAEGFPEILVVQNAEIVVEIEIEYEWP